MNNKLKIAASVLAWTALPALADNGWQTLPSDLFSEVSGSVNITFGQQTMTDTFVAANGLTTAKASIAYSLFERVADKNPPYFATRGVGGLFASSSARPSLTLGWSVEDMFGGYVPPDLMETSTWTGKITNHYSNSRTFYLGAGRSPNGGAETNLSVNGINLSPRDSIEPICPDCFFPYLVYSIGNLAAGESATVSFSLTSSPRNAMLDYSTNASIIRFAALPVSPVPEPATTAMMLAGIAILAMAAHKRSRVTQDISKA